MTSFRMGHYFKGMLWSSGANIVAMSAALATVMVAARILSKEDLGAYFLIMAIVQFAICLGDIGFKNAAVKFLSSAEGEEVNSISRYLLTINIIVSGVVCVILAIVLPELINLWPSSAFEKIVWYSIPTVFLLNNFQMGLSVLAGHRLFSSMSIITAVTELLRMGVSMSLLYSGFGVISLLFGMIVSRVIGLSFVWYRLPSLCMKPLFSYSRSAEIFQFGSWVYGSSLVSVIRAKTADMILTTYLGTAALATYSTAKQVPSMLQRIFESIKPLVLGYVSAQKLETFESSIVIVRLLSALISIGAIILIAIGQPLVIFIFSSKYEDSIPIMQLLSAWVSIGLVNYFLVITMIGMGYTKKAFFMSIFQSIVMTVSAILLVPDYHGEGAAVSLIITSIFGVFFGGWLVARGDLQIFYRIILAFLRSSLPILMLVTYIDWKNPTFIETIALSFSAVLAVFLLRGVTISDIRIMYGRVLAKD